MTAMLADVYDVDAYRTLFEYTRRTLMQAVGNPATDPPYPSLVHHMYADKIAVDTLFDQATQKLARIYQYHPYAMRYRVSLNADLVNSPIFDIAGDKRIVGGYVSNSWATWVQQHEPRVLEKRQTATQKVLLTALENFGESSTFELLEDLVYTIYGGLEILHFCFDIDDEHYAFCVKEQQIMERTDPETGRNVWLWYAHAIRSAMWALDIEAPELDDLINAVVNDRLPADVNPFTQYLQAN